MEWFGGLGKLKNKNKKIEWNRIVEIGGANKW